MLRSSGCLALVLGGALFPGLRAATPPLLAKAVQRWVAGQDGLAFTQQTRFLLDDGKLKEERVERYDPSVPDSGRWRLLEIDGVPATLEQREKWESKKNGKPRVKAAKAPDEYLDFEHAKLVEETSQSARFEIRVRPQVARLLTVEKISVIITVDKESGSIAGIAATLRQPIRVLLGLARITDLDIDVLVEPVAEASVANSGEVKTGSTAHVAMSKLGSLVEYKWKDFRRVTTYRSP